MIHKLGIPYMGSKRKLAKKIVDSILEDNPKCKYFFDLFGGGGAISFEAVQRPQIKRVVYNELNTGVVELLKHIRDNGVTSDMYKWVDRDTFNKYKNGNDWYSGYIKTVWSFGNNQSSYIFGRGIEDKKRLLHNAVVYQDLSALKEFEEKYGVEMPKDLIAEATITERRLAVRRYITQRQGELQQLEQLQQLERLERLEQLEQLERLDIQNKSYDEVVIDTPIDETIVYLDPPYENTEKYQKDINHKELYKYIRNSKYKIYMSSYESELYEVDNYKHRSTLSATANKEVTERLFCNRKYYQGLFSDLEGKI